MDDREAMKLALKDLERYESALHKARATIREALAEQPAQQEPEMPYTVMGGELDCSHAEELCKKLTETKGCWHTVIGTGQLKQDGSPAAWNCVMCGTSFAPKMSEKSLADLYQIGFSNGRKSAEILSPKKHPQPAQQEPVAKYMGKTYRCPIVNLYQDIPVGTLLYTTPAQRTWVGLTPEEVQEIHDTYHKRMGPQEFASMVEAKLKEKNQ